MVATYFQLFLSGLVLSSIYALMAIGLTLIYGITRVLNYAHGALFTMGAYFAWLLFTNFSSLNYFIVLAIIIVLMAGAGYLFEKVFVYPVRRLPEWDFLIIIVTLGAALLIDNVFLLVFGPLEKIIPKAFSGSFNLGGVVIIKNEIFIIAVAVTIIILLDQFLSRSRVGKSMRAVAQNEEGARIVGLSVDRIYSYSFAIAGALAGTAGVLLTPRTLIYPMAGWQVFLKALVVMVLGGLGSIKGTLYAAIILGMVEIFVTYFWGGRWALPIFILILILVLVFRPKGLAGTW